jgi:hypothetical protein
MNAPRNFWPTGIIVILSVFFCGTIGLLVLACSQKTDLVSADYYEQEIKFQHHMDSLTRAQSLGASVVYDSAARRIRISLPGEQAGRAVAGYIQLYRPSASALDRRVSLEPDSRGVQLLDAAALSPGLWKVRVSWKLERQDYFVDQMVVVPRPS